MKQIITAELEVVALGTGSTSMSRHVSEAVRAIKEMGLKYQVTPMGTAIEAESLDTILEAVKNAHEAVLRSGAARVVTHLTIDDRKDKPKGIEEKVKSVVSKLQG